MYDLVIIGAAAAGSAAAVYAARRNLNVVIVSKDLGGEVALCGEVENWPGIIHTTGIELAKSFEEHVKSYNVPTDVGYGVTKIEQQKNHHIVYAENSAGNKKLYETKAVIVATGIHPRTLGLPGEDALRGRGVTYCTVCDGPLFRGKVTATIGAGNAALESALMMSGIAEKVYLVTKYGQDDLRGGFPKGEDILIEKIKQHDNIEIIHNALTEEVLGEGMVSGFRYKDTATDEVKELSVNGIMVHIGTIPNATFIDCVEKNNAGEIITDKVGATSCKGLFAAGDVTNIPHKQISIAAGQGATAGLAAIEYLNYWKEEA